MSQKENILTLLQRGGYISGEEISRSLSISRSAVWKAVKSLRNEGYNIDAAPNKGYCLCGGDILSAPLIAKYLSFSANIEYSDVTVSTNDRAKQLAAQGAPEWTTIIAGEQTAGRGRRGRSFFSPQSSGIYMSVILRPDISVQNSLLITTAAAVAVCEAAEKVFSADTQIKWVNDIFRNGLKVCGILTEAQADIENGKLEYAVLGIGTNLFGKPFPPELDGIAGYLCDRSCTAEQKAMYAAEVLICFRNRYERLVQKNFLEDYRRRLMITGRRITIISGDSRIPATALGIDDNFRLSVRYDNGNEEMLSCGEVSVKP